MAEKEPGQDGLGDEDGRDAEVDVDPEGQEGQDIDADETDDEGLHGRRYSCCKYSQLAEKKKAWTPGVGREGRRRPACDRV